MKTLVITLGLLGAWLVGPVQADPDGMDATKATQLKLENLLVSAVEGVAGKEVIISRVVMPPNATLPKHWHPGEEFVVLLSGTVTLWQEGEGSVVRMAGNAEKIPFKQVHSAKAGDAGAVVLVFRIHETGQPERVLVE